MSSESKSALAQQSTAELRKQLRAKLRAKRNELTEAQQVVASEQLSSTLINMTQVGDTLALYFANDGELSPNKAIVDLIAAGRKVAVPVMHAFRKGYLNFQFYQESTPMHKNGFGIAEPVLNSTTTLSLETIDYLFMPLVGFDLQGNRMGMGGGYYDRTLSRIQYLQQKPKLVGLAHDCQQVEQLPIESWDVPIDMIITPTKKVMPKSKNK